MRGTRRWQRDLNTLLQAHCAPTCLAWLQFPLVGPLHIPSLSVANMSGLDAVCKHAPYPLPLPPPRKADTKQLDVLVSPNSSTRQTAVSRNSSWSVRIAATRARKGEMEQTRAGRSKDTPALLLLRASQKDNQENSWMFRFNLSMLSRYRAEPQAPTAQYRRSLAFSHMFC